MMEVETIFIESLPTFLGAVLAFLFGLFLYSLQKKTENGLYLSYTLSILASQSSSLYSLKNDIAADRKKEIELLENEFSNVGKRDVNLHMRKISQYITNGKNCEIPVDIEKLSFIADYDPNILAFVRTCINAGAGVDQLIEHCNLEITKARSGTCELHDFYLLVQINKQLLEQIDFAIILTEHLLKLLIDFSKLEFHNYVIINNVVIEEKYKILQPTSKTSWHELNYNKKKNRFNNIYRRLKRLLQC